MKRYLIPFAVVCGLASQAAATEPTSVLVDRVGNTGFIQLQAESFRNLNPRQQELAYWLTQAGIAIDPIIYDQLSSYGLRQKRLLEEIVARPTGIEPALRQKLETYTKLFWANRGNHNDSTSQKFLPTFSAAELLSMALTALTNGAFQTPCADLPALPSESAVTAEVTALGKAFFDSEFQPMMTAKTPPVGQDVISASSTTFYANGISVADLKNFHGDYPLNSRVVRDANAKLREEVYRAGTPDGKISAGLYAIYLNRAISCLQRAIPLAEPGQSEVLEHLIRFYQTGEFSDWLTTGSTWVQNDAAVDFANGFIEIYRDATGAKGSSQSFVTITDVPLTRTMAKLGANAAYFEDHAPWLEQYKKKDFRPPLVKAVEVLIETGDFSVTTIGDNLPNENEIHEKYGTKNFLFTASSRAFSLASGSKSDREFFASPETIARQAKFGDEAEELMTALHEVVGHGSGRLSEKLRGGSESYLKEYFSTLEEARADLMALWNVWDPKLKELGLIQNQDEVAKAMYDRAAETALVQLRSIPKGETIEEDHQRDRALIANYLLAKGAIEQFSRDGKTFVRVTDYEKMRAGVGELLAELMRIKAEGDYPAIKALIDKFGVHFDPAVRDQIVERFRALDLPTYWAGINPELREITGKGKKPGGPLKIEISYPRDPIHQYLNYASIYNPGLLQPAAR